MAEKNTPLIEALREYAAGKTVRFHMPGHKGGAGTSPVIKDLMGQAVLWADVTNIPGMDDLHQPTGIIRKAQELAARTFGAEDTYFLINGSSCGLMALIMATCRPDDKILVPRNIHRSILSGIILTGTVPVFFKPVYDRELMLPLAVSPETIRCALAQNPDARAVFVISPTYNGVTSDIGKIAAEVHRYGIPLMVDEAHGPHLGLHEDLPPRALECGADAVVHGTHKLLTSFTQASMLHVTGPRVDRARLEQSLRVLQSTSPSYLLLASLDAARADVAAKGRQMFDRALKMAAELRVGIRNIPGVTTFDERWAVERGAAGLDNTKVTITVKDLGITGVKAEAWLRKNAFIQVEMSDVFNLLVIVTAGNTPGDIARLVSGLQAVAAEAGKGIMLEDDFHVVLEQALVEPPETRLAVSPREAFFSPSVSLPLEKTAGEVAAETIACYPPGIPVLCPGEKITPQIIEHLQLVRRLGLHFQGPHDPTVRFIRVLKDVERAGQPEPVEV
jgi:lysine decarboxylase